MDDVAGYQAFLSQFAGRNVTGKSVQIHADEAGILLFVASCQQTGDNTREHVAAACRGHTCITRRVEDDVAVWKAEGRVVTLQDNIALNALCEITGLGEQFETIVAVTL